MHLTIRATSIDGPVIAATDGSAEPPQSGTSWHRFDLPAPVVVTPGGRYVIELSSDDNLLWVSNQGRDDCPDTGYPHGVRINVGEPDPLDDFLFAVFGSLDTP